MEKNLFIKTYGCQMNVYDSMKIGDVLKPFGYKITEDITTADMIILNTCHIREKAAEKIYSELGRIRKLKITYKQKHLHEMLIVVAGCVGQAEGEEIFKRSPWVDIVVGPQSYHALPELMAQIMRKQKHAIALSFIEEKKFDLLPDSLGSQGHSAFLSIQEGCDKFCKFCVVPYTRGAEFSRPVEQVYREALQISSSGSSEITLLGQNVNAYHGLNDLGKTHSLADLIRVIATIKEVKRIRYTTSHPNDMTNDLIEIHGSEPKLMPFLHLPIQSGSNKILRDMNRKHTVEQYLDTITRLRTAKPNIGFSSDFIVGYPGETEKDFDDTMELVKIINYAQAYSFKYSPRPGTPASIMEQVPEEVKSERLQQLQNLIIQQQNHYNNSFIGKTLEVLLEKPGRYTKQLTGRSQYMQAVHVDNAENFIGKIVTAEIIELRGNSLNGLIV